MKLKIFTVTIAFILSLVQFAVAFAQERVRVGWAAMTASHIPLWVAQDKGFLAKHGLAEESIFFGAGPPAMQALVAGDLDIVITSAPNAALARVHDRMPVLIEPRDRELWLDKSADITSVLQLLEPKETPDFEWYPVSTLVNYADNDVPECIQPLPDA